LQNTLNIIETAIQQEAHDRQQEDTVLNTKIDQEIQQRTHADTTHANLTTAHSSTTTPEANRIAMYGAEKGLKSDKVPAQSNDVVRKTELDAEAADKEKELSILTDQIGALRLLATLNRLCLGTLSGMYIRQRGRGAVSCKPY
jgi:hypothetical protein